MKSKSEVTSLFQQFYKMVQVQYKSQIQVIRSDNYGEYVNSELRAFLDHHGIFHQTTCPYTPQQNGDEERKNCQLLKVVCASFLNARLPLSSWGEALTSAAYLMNHVPSRSVDFQTPLQTLSSYIDDLTVPNLPPHVFCYVAFVHLHKQQRRKLEPRALLCVFVGVYLKTKRVSLLSPSDKKIHENDMYFANPESSPQRGNQTKVQTLNYTIPNIDNVNDLDLSGDVLEIRGDHSHENNDVNELELSGNVLETSDDQSHGNNVENLQRDESTSPKKLIANFLTTGQSCVASYLIIDLKSQ